MTKRRMGLKLNGRYISLILAVQIGKWTAARARGGRRAAGGLCRVCREVRKSLSPGPGRLTALRAGALLPAEASFLLSALQALSSALPASLREGRETGLGEVERFIPGEQAGERGGAVRADVTVPHPGHRACRLCWGPQSGQSHPEVRLSPSTGAFLQDMGA